MGPNGGFRLIKKCFGSEAVWDFVMLKMRIIGSLGVLVFWVVWAVTSAFAMRGFGPGPVRKDGWEAVLVWLICWGPFVVPLLVLWIPSRICLVVGWVFMIPPGIVGIGSLLFHFFGLPVLAGCVMWSCAAEACWRDLRERRRRLIWGDDEANC